MNTSFVYPATPVNVPLSVTKPSLAFKKGVSGVMSSIVFFFIVYLLLFILAIGLVIGCFYAGIAIITTGGHLLIILAGLGLMGVGVMVFIFLVKFLFAVSKYDRSGIMEITEEEQPALFGFIRQLTTDTQTRFPRKIFLSADVNACVFYDSSFWSMFFPVKKNLQIGLGLVNSLNVSEFKAVMAHEFGHFSQRSMKLGSFVYHVNKIIYNMLFDNKGYAGFLKSWASIHGVFALFANITVKIAEGIQWILRQMYGIINKNYLQLSREMEFHADAVAASVSGSKSLVTALRRVELANSGYNITLQKCDELFRQKKITGNIYPNQTSMLLQMAAEYELPLEYNLPVVSDEFLKNHNLSRVNFKDQWASHPTTEDREKHLIELSVPAEIMQDTAWMLFNEKEELQKKLTSKIYAALQIEPDMIKISDAEFDEKIQQDIRQFSFPEKYNGFYDNRQIAIPDKAESQSWAHVTEKKFEEIFSDDNASLPKMIKAAAGDIELLKAIADKRIKTKTFDFDGIKYDKEQAGNVAAKLEQELTGMQAVANRLDKEAVEFFLVKAGNHGKETELKQDYEFYYDLREKADSFLKQMNEMLEVLGPVFSGQSIPVEEIKNMIGRLKRDHEPGFKRKLQFWISNGTFNMEPELMNKINKFINSNYVYFGQTSFFENELQTLHSLCNESWSAVSKYIFVKFKSILEKQLTYIN